MKMLFTLSSMLLLLPVLALFAGQIDAQAVPSLEYKDGAWKITRVISYDHHAAPK